MPGHPSVFRLPGKYCGPVDRLERACEPLPVLRRQHDQLTTSSLNKPIERSGAAIAKQTAQRIIDDLSQEY